VDGFQFYTAPRYNAGAGRYSHRRGAHFADIGVHLFRYAGDVHPSATLGACGILFSEHAFLFGIQDARLTLAGLWMMAIPMKSIGLVFPILAARHSSHLGEEFGHKGIGLSAKALQKVYGLIHLTQAFMESGGHVLT
jgi:hypothetical protein